MDEAVYSFSAFTVTNFSIAVCIASCMGSVVLYLLSAAKRISKNTVFMLIPLTVLTGILFGHALFAALRVLIYPLDYEHPLSFIVDPRHGGFMFFGVLAGAALSCAISAKAGNTSFSALIGVLFPALMIALAFIRFSEPLILLGKGPGIEGGFFPISYAPEPDYPEDRYIPAFLYAGVYTLFIGIWNTHSILKKNGIKRPTLFFFVLYLSGQMFFEVFRQDEYVNATSLITFIRLNQLIAAILLGICLLYALIKCSGKVPAGTIVLRCFVFAISVGACIGLQFLFDKPLPFFGETVWFPDWLVYILLALSAIGMGWPVLSLLKHAGITDKQRA